MKGHINHTCLRYEIIIPFLRVFHNTIDSYEDNRNKKMERRRLPLKMGTGFESFPSVSKQHRLDLRQLSFIPKRQGLAS